VLLGIFILAVAIAYALMAPGTVLRFLPRLAQAYSAIGLNVNLRGFEFEHVSARFEEVGGARFLAIEGMLRNVAQETRDAPRLRLTLYDAQAVPVYVWAASSGVKVLQAGETAPFRARLAAPPVEAQSVTVDFMP
jgi:hypothetical protein